MSRLRFKLLSTLLPIIALVLSAPAFSAPSKATVRDVRMSASGDTTRVVFDLSQAAGEQVFTLHSPERVVIDLSDARLDLLTGSWPASLGVVKEFRSAERGNGVLRIVLEVSQPVESRTFSLEPADGMGYRLVVDIAGQGKLGPLEVSAPPVTVAAAPKPTKSLIREAEGRTLIIAVDAGHGGQDPGATGRKGTREKDVTLAIARKLKEAIDAEPGMRAVLIRDADYFVPLRDRIVRASKQKADLFISIHADSVRDHDVTGSSVYVLSSGRATNEAARMLADRENAADLMGGLTLDNKDDVLASVLLGLSQDASMSASAEAADRVLSQLARVSEVLDNEVKHASLKVLTSPNMPSMLVETAFISNLKEESKLKDSRHQQRLAEAMLRGVRAYFYENPLPGTLVAQRVAQLRNDKSTRGSIGVPGILAGGIPQ